MSKVKIATQGEYSDYSVVAVLEWRSALAPKEALAKYLAEFPPPANHAFGWEPDFEPTRFVGWLSLNGYATDLEADELHLGDYGRLPDAKEWK